MPFWQRIGFAFVLVVALWVVFDRLGLLRFSPEIGTASGLGAIFVIGLVAAFSSCTAVVGGLLAAVSAHRAQTQQALTLRERMRPHVLFNVGRVLGFGLLGALLGLIGSVFQISSFANGVLLIAVALLMIGLGVQLMGVTPLIALHPPKRIAHWVHDLAERQYAWVPLVLGAATFFLPCGFTQSVQLLAMATGSPLQAGVMMAVFALGTLPALLGIGYVMSTAATKALPTVTYAIGAVVIVLGIANILNGATLMGFAWPVTELASSSVASVVGEEQVVAMAVTSAGVYEPSVLRVRQGVPVRWEITRDAWVGCASTLVLPAFGVNQSLQEGENVISFTPTRTGSFRFSCAMGMVRGTLVVE